MSGYRLPYSGEEETQIIKYIIETKSYNCLRGRKFWLELEAQEWNKRTWQSLKEHFRKKMVSNLYIGQYDISLQERDLILEGIKS